MMVEVVYCARKAESIRNPFRTVPAPDPLDVEWGELRKDHPSPIIAIALGVVEKQLNSFYLLCCTRDTDDVVVFRVLLEVEVDLPYPLRAERLDAN